MTPLTIEGGRASDRGRIVDELIDKGLGVQTRAMNDTPPHQMRLQVEATPGFLRNVLQTIGHTPVDVGADGFVVTLGR